MTLSIKSIGGTINNIPVITNLKVDSISGNIINISYHVEDADLTICRHYLTVKNSKEIIINHLEITKNVGYDKLDFKYSIKNLEMGTAYTIEIYCGDGLEEGKSEAIQATTETAYVYGVSVDESNSNPQTSCTYIEEAINTSPATSNDLGGWANKWPFKLIKIVGLKNGVETKEINPLNKKEYLDGDVVPRDVDVMVKFPKIFWNFKNITNGYELRITNSNKPNFECLAHTVNGKEVENIYIGAYLAFIENGRMRSISGVTPTSEMTLTNFRKYARANGEGYEAFNWYPLKMLQILYLIAYKNLNSQQALGKGRVNGATVNTGGTDTKGIIYGSQNANQVCFLGLEDFYGNLSQLVDGIYFETKNIMATSNNSDFNDNRNGYVNIGIGKQTYSGNLTKVKHENKNAFFPIELVGSSTTNYCDAACVVNNGHAYFGGCAEVPTISSPYTGVGAGAFCFGIGLTTSGTKGKSYGSRLVYFGGKESERI